MTIKSNALKLINTFEMHPSRADEVAAFKIKDFTKYTNREITDIYRNDLKVLEPPVPLKVPIV